MKYQHHPLSVIFPLMSENETNALASDIKANGLKLPITLCDDKILDGRNRYRACQIAGVEPRFETFSGDSPLAHVISLNIARRQLNESQRGMVGAKLANIPKHLHKTDAQICASQTDTAALLNVSRRTIQTAKALLHQSPELAKKVEQGEMTLNKAIRLLKDEQDKAALAAAQKHITAAKRKSLQQVCDLRCCSCADLFKTGIKPDAVITDPPYPKEFLHCFTELAEGCKAAAVPLVAVMVGQTYLPDILAILCTHLTYRWTLAYLTPGGQSVQQWQAKINTFWKPILLFGSGDWIGDVAKSDPNDNDKRFHDWGQSESGMADLVQRLTKPGQLICDPFMGAGTTAVACLALGRRFIGCDIDKSCVDQTRTRVETMQ